MINKEDCPPSLKWVRCRKGEIFVEMFGAKLESWSSNMAAGKEFKHLEITFAIYVD